MNGGGLFSFRAREWADRFFGRQNKSGPGLSKAPLLRLSIVKTSPAANTGRTGTGPMSKGQASETSALPGFITFIEKNPQQTLEIPLHLNNIDAGVSKQEYHQYRAQVQRLDENLKLDSNPHPIF